MKKNKYKHLLGALWTSKVISDYDLDAIYDYAEKGKNALYMPYSVADPGIWAIDRNTKKHIKNYRKNTADQFKLNVDARLQKKGGVSRLYPPLDINDPNSPRVTPQYMSKIINNPDLDKPTKLKEINKMINAYNAWGDFIGNTNAFLSQSYWKDIFSYVSIKPADIKPMIAANDEFSDGSLSAEHLKNWRSWFKSY